MQPWHTVPGADVLLVVVVAGVLSRAVVLHFILAPRYLILVAEIVLHLLQVVLAVVGRVLFQESVVLSNE